MAKKKEEEVVEMNKAIEEAAANTTKEDERLKNVSDDWKRIIEEFDECVFEDQEHIALICETANALIYDRFRIQLNNPEDPFRDAYKMTAMIFVYTFRSILKLLRTKREGNSTYEINIGNRFIIGYSNQDSIEDEKNGNFMIFIRDLKHYSGKDDTSEYRTAENAKEYITAWNSENMIHNPQTVNAIAADAIGELKKINIFLGNSELVFPIYVTIYDALVDYIKIRRRELNLDEFEINFCSCFCISANEQDDGIDRIAIRPLPEQKLFLKSDKIATSIYD